MKKNNDDFKLNYWKLSYRQKFIRTLWTSPFIAVIIYVLSKSFDTTEETIILSSLLVIVYITQLIYTYIKWKSYKK